MTNKEAIEILKSHISIYDCCKADHDANEAIRLAIKALEERQKGKWIFKQDSPLIPTGYWQCSECKKGRLLVEENFCPNCGASMTRFPDLKSSV